MALLVWLAFSTPEAQAFYNPQTGRWLSRDPVGESGALNVNIFINNAPTHRIDYLGLFDPGRRGFMKLAEPILQASERCCCAVGYGLATTVGSVASVLFATTTTLNGGEDEMLAELKWNPSSSPHTKIFQCKPFAIDFKKYCKKYKLCKRKLNYVLYESKPGETWRDYIYADQGRFAGYSISETGKHYGVRCDDDVYDNNFPSGTPYSNWLVAYLVVPMSTWPDPITLGHAVAMGVGTISEY